MPRQREPSLEGLLSFLEYAPDPAVVTDQAHRIVLVNHSAESLFGYRRLELVGRPLRELVPNLRAVDSDDGPLLHEETTILGQHRNGTPLTLSVAFRAVPLEQGLLTATYFRAQSPADSPSGAASTLDRLPIAVVRFAADGGALYANGTARLLLGTGGVIGPALDSLILPVHSREELRVAFQSARDGRPARLELPIRTFGGERWLECHVMAESRPGDVDRSVLLVATDLTPHRDAEHALRRAELRFARIAEGSEDLISQHSPAGEFTYASPASSALLGLPPTSILGRSLLDFVAARDQERIRDALHSLERSASTGLLSYRLMHADGRTVWCETSAHAAPAGPEGAPAIICITRDITERIRSEEILRTASRMDTTATLAAGVAHDFNNLLTGILGNAELLLKDGKYRDAGAHLEQIADAAKRGVALARQLLAYARGGRDKVEPVDLNDILHQALHLQRHATPPRIQLEEDLDRSVPAVEADPVQLGQVITNLCINACEATPGVGRVTVRTRKVTLTAADVATKPGLVPGPAVLLEVHDTGQGMDPSTRARIFEPFFSTKFQGRGLGLAAAYGIVKNHRGYIGVESVVGRGTTFALYFPANAAAPKPVAAAKDGYPTGTETILLVDDDEAVLQVTRSILERLQYRVVMARNGIEAVAVARAFQGEIHLAILDMGMPLAGGAEAFPFLRASRPSMRILISSGYEMNDVVQNLLTGGANAFLQKPFRVSVLAKEIRAVLDRTPAPAV